MYQTLVLLTLAIGLASTLPTNNHEILRTRKNTASNGRLGIYDGTSTTIAKHNYLVGILIDEAFYCAGAIVGESYVLTLADCVVGVTTADVTVVAGSSDGTKGTTFSVKKIINNPSYSESTASYDFALLKIKGTFTFGDDIGAVTLPSADPKSGAALVAAGYGDTGTMKYMNGTICETYYSEFGLTFDASMACAYNKGKVTMCEGDFGNPFVKGRVLYGLMIAGGTTAFCTSTAIPVLIADVFSAVDWINKYVS